MYPLRGLIVGVALFVGALLLVQGLVTILEMRVAQTVEASAQADQP